MDNRSVAATVSTPSLHFHASQQEIAMSTNRPPPAPPLFRITAIGLATAPFATALMSGTAHAVDTVKESDPTATLWDTSSTRRNPPNVPTRRPRVPVQPLFGEGGRSGWSMHDLSGQAGQRQGLVLRVGEEGLNL
jgi:hypothetical protein